jgi:hypothetical protein
LLLIEWYKAIRGWLTKKSSKNDSLGRKTPKNKKNIEQK